MNALTDLRRSALEPEDLDARPISSPERSALDIPMGQTGYIIPYYDINGLPTTFYRARLIDSSIKYKQPRASSNQVFFPKRFKATLNGHKYVIITEGEKKAATADKHGFPCIALGGVYSWKNRTVTLPETAVVTQNQRRGNQTVDLGIATANRLHIRLPEEFDPDKLMSEYASGFEAFVQLVKERNLTVIIVFDSSAKAGGLTYDVQRAASRLAFEFRFQGIPLSRIRQLILPTTLPGHDNSDLLIDQDLTVSKMGLDDYIVSHGAAALEGLLQTTLGLAHAFPKHPNISTYISKKLQNARISRKETGLLGLTIVADLDSNGSRLRSKTGNMYYFDGKLKKLMRATSPGRVAGQSIVDDGFNTLLYRNYGITPNDGKLMRNLSVQFSGEEPVQEVEPKRNLFVRNDTIFYQINNSEYITCNKDHPASVHDNGTNGVMFESVDQFNNEIVTSDFKAEVARQQRLQSDHGKLFPWWENTLLRTRLKGLPDDQKLARITTLLFYVSPWLFRWRGTQLPVELATGEAGSGKSTLYGLRLNILSGGSDLKNTPQSIRDWHASVANTGGLHVIDNANLADKGLKQQMSDEMCRIVTEDMPTVEMRKFYTEHDLVRVPVSAVFALTAVSQPFHQTDLIARSLHIELDKGIRGSSYDAEWALHQLNERGGRTAWVVHHLLVLQRFFQLVDESWDHKYKASFRLINFEQAMCTMAKVFGWDHSWIPEYLSHKVADTAVAADWVLQGLNAYVDEFKNKYPTPAARAKQLISAGDIANWAAEDEDFKECVPLANSRRLGRYLQMYKQQVKAATGIYESGSRANKVVYRWDENHKGSDPS